jgi:alkanesulfonate monooxygenase SsuD/methylene tetrahydromethanopterin reductase-like flavin-dependent oxidoreductase (luciferase family)
VSTFTLGLAELTYGATWPAALETARLADDLGYDHLFTADHLYATGGDPGQAFFEGWMALAAWAQATRHVDLGLLVGANTFRNPGVVAKMAATIDHISGGRAILGLGAAWEEDEQRAHGIDPGRSLGQRLDWLDESLTIIRGILAGAEVTWTSDKYRFDHVRHAPLPIRRPMPVLVGAYGEKKGLRIVAKHATLWQVWVNMDDLPEFQRLDGVLRRHCDDVGRDEREIRRLVGAKVVIRSTRAAAEEAFNRQLEIQPWRGEVLDYIRQSLWAGTPDDVTRAIERYRPAGLDGFVAQVYPPYDHETIEALATTVRERIGEPVPTGEESRP